MLIKKQEVISHYNLPISWQTLRDEQYSPWEHEGTARHVEVDWQVRGPPVISSLHEVRPVTVEQSDVTEQNTERTMTIMKKNL